jgi:hypothetical protein
LITTCRFEEGRENKIAGVRAAVLSACGLFTAVFEALLRFFGVDTHLFQTLPDGHIQVDFREVAFAVASIFCFQVSCLC